jgi:hypothetical protein
LGIFIQKIRLLTMSDLCDRRETWLLTSPHQAGLVQQRDQIVARFVITIYLSFSVIFLGFNEF